VGVSTNVIWRKKYQNRKGKREQCKRKKKRVEIERKGVK
jgi:hypothetical protein